jgi:hypothetical protein
MVPVAAVKPARAAADPDWNSYNKKVLALVFGYNPFSVRLQNLNLTLVTKDLLSSNPASSDMLRVVTACRGKLDGAKAIEHPATRATTVDRSNMVKLC